jgi:hypothetical protein
MAQSGLVVKSILVAAGRPFRREALSRLLLRAPAHLDIPGGAGYHPISAPVPEW